MVLKSEGMGFVIAQGRIPAYRNFLNLNVFLSKSGHMRSNWFEDDEPEEFGSDSEGERFGGIYCKFRCF